MADLQVDLSSFGAGSGQVRSAAASLDMAAQALSAALAGTGGMAGADKVGQQFSAQYDPAAAAVVELLGQLGPGLGTVADAVDATGANYGAADSGSVMNSSGPGAR